MYSQYDAKIIDDARMIVLQNDRRLYDPFITTIASFVIQYDIAVGGKIAAMLLTGTENPIDYYVWDLYVDNAYAIGKQLSVALYETKSPHIQSYTTVLKIDVRDTEFTVYVNSRPIVKLFNMRTYKSLKASELMRRVYGKPNLLKDFTQTSDKIRCAPQELMLIEVYHLLYKPPLTPDVWADSLNIEKFLNDDLVTKDGGSTKKLIMSGVVDKHCIVIGEYALAAFNIAQQRSPRLQLITDIPIEEFARQIENVIKRKVTEFEPGTIATIRQSLAVPIDFQLIKHSLYINRPSGNEFICDVYNSTTYELVPYIKIDKIKFGSPWVLLRFLYIELWVLELIAGYKNDRALTKNKSNLLKTWIQKTRNSNIEKFPLTYDGVYLPLAVAKKKMGLIFTAYRPALDT